MVRFSLLKQTANLLSTCNGNTSLSNFLQCGLLLRRGFSESSNKKDESSASQRQWEIGSTMPLAVFKDEAAPTIKEDHEYPEWLWNVDKLESLAELEARKDTLTWDNGGQRYFRLLRKEKMRKARKMN